MEVFWWVAKNSCFYAPDVDQITQVVKNWRTPTDIKLCLYIASSDWVSWDDIQSRFRNTPFAQMSDATNSLLLEIGGILKGKCQCWVADRDRRGFWSRANGSVDGGQIRVYHRTELHFFMTIFSQMPFVMATLHYENCFNSTGHFAPALQQIY